MNFLKKVQLPKKKKKTPLPPYKEQQPNAYY
jgi:hypothetical protein